MKNLILVLIIFFSPITTRANLVFEFLWGYNLNLPSTMTEYGLGSPIVYNPQWESRSFTVVEDSPYWAARNGIWNSTHKWGIELEWIHQKIFLINTNSHIQHFDISHGYNLFLLNYANKLYANKGIELIARIGFGMVIAHAESIIDGVYNGTGGKSFTVAGVGGQLALQMRIPIADYLIGFLELKYTAGYAKVPYSGKIDPSGLIEPSNFYTGEFHVPHHAIHFTWGFGVDFYHMFNYKRDYSETAKRAWGTSISSIQEMQKKRAKNNIN
ncbi:MAG: hypothetical protein KFW21_04435 [Spirochaetota bacterium]|nr:hypothetical protein [Spirochaetota bacterium]